MRSTRGAIIDQALQRVGNTTATLIQAARFKLNRILQELHLGADWPFLWRRDAVVIQPNGVVVLPDGFLKPEDTESLVVNNVGGNFYGSTLHEVDHRTFYAQGDSFQVSATIPVIWTIDYSIPVGQAWPRPNERCDATLRYKFLPPDMPLTDAALYDNDIPAFPWDSTLSDILFEWAMAYEVDPRRGDQYTVNLDSIARIRGASFPERSYPSQVPLEPLIFSTPWQGN